MTTTSETNAKPLVACEEFPPAFVDSILEQAGAVADMWDATTEAEHMAGIRRWLATGARLPAPTTPPKAANDNHKGWPGIVSSGDLVRSFTPPDYQIDGIAQSGFVYSLTGSTGTGKTAILLLAAALTALGEPLGDREVRQGRVLYLAGENPADVTMRWLGMAHAMGFDPDTIDVHFVPGTFEIAKLFTAVEKELDRIGGAVLVVVDTSAAYFTGSDENSNAEAGAHARTLRTLTTLPGAPCVLVATHPTKNADPSNLQPRGGGAFIAEMDGNLVCMRTDSGAVRLHWQGKFRGPDFEPLLFDLSTVTAPMLKDSRGRDIPTVIASVVPAGEIKARMQAARRDEDEILLLIDRDGSQSLTDMAVSLDWSTPAGEPHKRRVSAAMDKLKKDKLATWDRRAGWKLTAAGHEARDAARGEHFDRAKAAAIASRVLRSVEAKTGRPAAVRNAALDG